MKLARHIATEAVTLALLVFCIAGFAACVAWTLSPITGAI